MTASAPIIELRNASKAYGNHAALADVSISVYPGEVHCLLGDNGAGKSTLIKMMSGDIPCCCRAKLRQASCGVKKRRKNSPH